MLSYYYLDPVKTSLRGDSSEEVDSSKGGGSRFSKVKISQVNRDSTWLTAVMNILALLGLLASFLFSVTEAAGKGPQYPFITHVLDVSRGKPGSGMKVQFFRKEAGGWRLFQDTLTSFDGRIGNLIPKEKFLSGTYKLVYHLGKYFEKEGKKDYFHPQAEVIVNIKDPKKLYQVTMIVTPFSYVVSSVHRIVES
eukprot:gene3808-15096_t